MEWKECAHAAGAESRPKGAGADAAAAPPRWPAGLRACSLPKIPNKN